MNTTTSVVATFAVVAAGRWAEEKPIDIKIGIGAGVLAISLSLINSANEKLGSQFAILVMVAALFKYAPTIAKKTGMTK